MTVQNNLSTDAQRALDTAVLQHLFDPNVAMIDVGYRIRDRRGHRLHVDETCVRVHVHQKLRGEAFAAFAAQYPERVVDAKRLDFPVDVPEATYSVQPWWPWYWQPPLNPRTRAFNPLVGGISVSNGLLTGSGTLGGLVQDRVTGDAMILSNWHVLVGGWHVFPDTPIYQPGTGDAGGPAHTVAHLSRDGMSQHLDAAVALVDGTRPLINEQHKIGPVCGAGNPMLGQTVYKSGRTTGVTYGIVSGIDGYLTMYYGGVRRVIRHTIHISQMPTGGQVSAPGDSGSWWLDVVTNCAIGLHFAGSNDPEFGVAMAMPQVLDALDVEIVPELLPERNVAGSLERYEV
ncbi:MAG: hypothetical protein KC419_22480 [Anaerolineales bacterium]|nr:hypothetical protein [Anaerolineales bacterium]